MLCCFQFFKRKQLHPWWKLIDFASSLRSCVCGIMVQYIALCGLSPSATCSSDWSMACCSNFLCCVYRKLANSTSNLPCMVHVLFVEENRNMIRALLSPPVFTRVQSAKRVLIGTLRLYDLSGSVVLHILALRHMFSWILSVACAQVLCV